MQIPRSPIRALLKKLIVRGLASVDARMAVGRAISRNGEELIIGRRRYDLRRYERVVVVGAGKATAPMAQPLFYRLGHRGRRLPSPHYDHTPIATQVIPTSADDQLLAVS